MSDETRYLIDTSAWIEALRANGEPATRARVAELIATNRAVLCDLVRLELWNGAQGSRESRMLREVEITVDSVPTNSEVWELARQLSRSARENGLTVPVTDLLIAACAKHHGLGILHRDAHFDALARVTGSL